MDALEAATVQELMAELRKRATAAILLVVTPAMGSDATDVYHSNIGGCLTTCLGLIERGRVRMRAECLAMDFGGEDDE